MGPLLFVFVGNFCVHGFVPQVCLESSTCFGVIVDGVNTAQIVMSLGGGILRYGPLFRRYQIFVCWVNQIQIHSLGFIFRIHRDLQP